MNNQLAEKIYELLTGERLATADDPLVENMFAEGRTCKKLYNGIYEANLRLCERLGVQEDGDVELIIDSLLRISKLLGKKMFQYGLRYQSGQLDEK